MRSRQRQTTEHRRELLLQVLKSSPGVEFNATGLGEKTTLHPKWVRRALTVNKDEETPIPGVRMSLRFNADGDLKHPAYWFSWIGEDSVNESK